MAQKNKTLATITQKLGLLYGGDYNPEQWPEDVWLEDARLMQRAGVNIVSVAIFGWARIEVDPGVYDFDWLDRVLDVLHQHGISVALATATASPPPWFSLAHPESLPVDRNGLRYKVGSRQHYCPNSNAYRELAAKLVEQIVARYRNHPAVVLWHVNNEYGCHNSECYCDVCTKAFREWLKQRYAKLDAVNDAWGTDFWSQHYYHWDEIGLPNRTITFSNPGQVLDYRRFMNSSLLELFKSEVAIIHKLGAEQPVCTNAFSGTTALDKFSWVETGDFEAFDNYPDPSFGDLTWRNAAFWHDLTRGLGQGSPFLVMEQASTQVNWRETNQLKAPGMMRALSYQALARGADGVMYFQWRASRAGAEKFHSGMVPHFGVKNSRVFNEVEQLGNELKQLRVLSGSRVPAKVAILFSYENLWALELDSKPTRFNGLAEFQPWYDALASQNIPIDIVHPDMDFSGYSVIVAPILYQMTHAQAQKMRGFVERGGKLVMTYFSGVVDDVEHIWLDGYLAALVDVFGIRVEEWQPFLTGQSNQIVPAEGSDIVACTRWADLVEVNTATSLALFGGDFYAGRAAITRNAFGAGQAYYLATLPSEGYLCAFLGEVCRAAGIQSPVRAPDNVEATIREGSGGRFLFLINHGTSAAAVDLLEHSGVDLLTKIAVDGHVTLKPNDVMIIDVSSTHD